MFKFLKEKISNALGRFSKEVEKESEEVKPEEIPIEEKTTEMPKEAPSKKEEPQKKEVKPKAEEKPAEKKPEKKHLKEKESKPVRERKPEEKPEKIETPEKKEKPEEPRVEEKEKKGFFGRISDSFTKIQLSEEKFEELFWDLEVMLLENNVAVEVIQKIKEDLKQELTTNKISRKNTSEIIRDTLMKSLSEVLETEKISLEEKIKQKKPYIIAVIGVNGSGKTTTIAKLAYKLKNQGLSIVVAAADTFRAAAIQQLEEHCYRLSIKMIKHDYNSDPAAVAFDAVKHANAKNIDVVIIDTAGRLHSNDNLMNELKKVVRVSKPDLKLFVGESITGNDCVEQAKIYDEIIGIDAIILSKADVDEKGGAAISISYVTKKPLVYIGTGQKYEDLEEFSKEKTLASIGL